MVLIYFQVVMQIKSTQNLLEIIDIRKGILILRDNTFAEILKVFPINFNLKSEYEKSQIFNQYSQFLKICNYNFQIIIKTKKEKVNNHITYIESLNSKNNEIQTNYINHILSLTNSEYIYSKEFYIIYSIKNTSNKNINQISNELNKMYLSIKENLSKCGNIVSDLSEYTDDYLIKLISSFINEKENKYEVF